jgi:phosphoglycerol transferase
VADGSTSKAGRTPESDSYALLGFLGEAGSIFTLLFVFLEGWRRDFRVPLDFTGDSLEYLMQVKGTIENGWWWVHPRLAAPGVFEQVQFPSNPTVDQAIVWIVHLFTHEPGLAINSSWMIMVVLSGLIASRCLAFVGISRPVGWSMGLLFALSPYAVIRNINHFSLAIYLVPIPCTVALLAATGRLQRLPRARRWALGAGCVLLGLNYPYYAFFGCFLILVALLLASAVDRNHRELGSGLLLVGVICLATTVNLGPSLYTWAEHGKPLSIPEKHAAEAEQYGLKIRQLVSPIRDHALSLFRDWTLLEERAQYPLEGENTSSRLGLIGTVGFLTLLGGLFAPRIAAALSDGALFLSTSRLTLAALLLGTIGGFGSLFNLLVSPDIRAYNRLAPFISFFSLIAIGLMADTLLRASSSSRLRRRVTVSALSLLVLIGVYDQAQAAGPINLEHQTIRSEWIAIANFVRPLEERLPAGAMVFQLPAVTFLNETGRERMGQFDHIKLYLPSTRLHWSYPALSDEVVRWQQQVGRLPPRVLSTALASQGFTAILLDRNGYADRGESILAELGVSSSSEAVLAENARYVAVDLGRAQKADVPADRLPRLGDRAAATPGVPACGTTTPHSLGWIGEVSTPFEPSPIRVSSSGEFSVTGWAVDGSARNLAGDVDILIGDTAFQALYGIERPDVALYLGSQAYQLSGFTARLTGADVGSDARPLSIRILSSDRRCYYQGQTVWIEAR